MNNALWSPRGARAGERTHAAGDTDVFAFALKTVVLVSNVFASLRKLFLFYLICSLRFENNLLSSEGVRFASI